MILGTSVLLAVSTDIVLIDRTDILPLQYRYLIFGFLDLGPCQIRGDRSDELTSRALPVQCTHRFRNSDVAESP